MLKVRYIAYVDMYICMYILIQDMYRKIWALTKMYGASVSEPHLSDTQYT